MVKRMLLLLIVLVVLTGSSEAKIVCTTTVLASIVEDLTGEKCEVIAPPTVCPAHYDVKPSDVEKVREADLIICHGIEPWIDELVKTSKKNITVLKVPGPWNTPQLLREKYTKIANELKKFDYDVNLEKCLESINKTESYLKEFAKEHGFVNTPVVCMQWQKSFVEFLGFKVLATYPPPEMVSAKKYEEIIEKGRGSKLVVDNLQSGTELGKKIAKELGAVEVALSNFPIEGNVTDMMVKNAEKLAKALEEKKEKKTPGFEVAIAVCGLTSALAFRKLKR